MNGMQATVIPSRQNAQTLAHGSDVSWPGHREVARNEGRRRTVGQGSSIAARIPLHRMRMWHRVGNVEAVLSAPDHLGKRPHTPREFGQPNRLWAIAQNAHLQPVAFSRLAWHPWM